MEGTYHNAEFGPGSGTLVAFFLWYAPLASFKMLAAVGQTKPICQ